MKTIYDERTDTLFVRLADAPIVESAEIASGVIFDYDAEGRMVAFEILDASKNISRSSDLIRAHAGAADRPRLRA